MNSSNENISEGENGTKERKAKISKLAIASVFLGLLGFFIIVLRITAYRPWWSEFVGRNVIGLSGIAGLILGMVALAGISKIMPFILASLIFLYSFSLFCFGLGNHDNLFGVCGFLSSLVCLVGLLFSVAALPWILSSTGKFRGSEFIIWGMVLAMSLSAFWWMETCGPMSSAAGMICSNNLIELHKAMLIYTEEHEGRYPDPNHWCDSLLQHTKVDATRFFCPGVKLRWKRKVLPWPIPRKARCYYAMNPNCCLNSPPDTVLLFETKGGWNQSGGPEILSMDNHLGHSCHILFNDGQVKHLNPSSLGQLKWKVEQDQNEPVKKIS